jgi:hypothetical protein
MPSEVYKPSFLSVLASLVLVIASLYWAKAVLVPLALAFMLTFLLQPIVAALHRRGLGHTPAVVLVVILLAAVAVPVVPEEDAAAALPPKVRILACPAHHEADEVALQMFQHVLDPRRFEVECTKTTLLTAAVVSLVEQTSPEIVCIGLVPPGGFAQTRYLCKRLRARFPTLPIVVGCWGAPKDEVEHLARLGLDSIAHTSTTLLETRNQIMQVPQRHTPLVSQAVASVA